MGGWSGEGGWLAVAGGVGYGGCKQTSSPKGNDAHLRALGSRYYACP